MNKSHPQTITETGDDLSHLFLSYLADAAQQTLSAFQRIIVLPAWIQIGINIRFRFTKLFGHYVYEKT